MEIIEKIIEVRDYASKSNLPASDYVINPYVGCPHACGIQQRLAALEELHNQGIYTVLFISPIFPYITNFQAIIECSKPYVDEYWFENLNLRGGYKQNILSFV